MTQTRTPSDSDVSHIYKKLLNHIKLKSDHVSEREEMRINYLIKLAESHGEDFVLAVRKKAENEITKLKIRYAQNFRLINPSLDNMFWHDHSCYPYRNMCSEIDNALEIARAIKLCNKQQHTKPSLY